MIGGLPEQPKPEKLVDSEKILVIDTINKEAYFSSNRIPRGRKTIR